MRSAAQGERGRTNGESVKSAQHATPAKSPEINNLDFQSLSTDIKVTRQIFAFPNLGTSSELRKFSAPLYEMPSLVCTVASWGAALRRLYTMALAPLRRIRLRTIEVVATHQDKPTQFVIIDQLECGHTHSDFQWTLLDLVNPYSENAKAKRHRCRECAAIISKKKPQSVRILREVAHG